MNDSHERLDQAPIDEQLKQLALAAQQHPLKSRERQQALTKLITTLQKSRKLVRPRLGSFLGFYEDIHAEALQRLFTHICMRIDTYNPRQGGVLQWANFLLSKRFFTEASREWMPTVYKGQNPKEMTLVSSDELDKNNPSEVNPQLIPSVSQEVQEVLEEDPEGLFKSSYVAKCPHANFQLIALKRLSGSSWQELSAELDVSTSTLSSFYQRRLDQFAPKIKEYLS
jgi:DNA-directed RNA polymerase specialized sigma24 family protein